MINIDDLISSAKRLLLNRLVNPLNISYTRYDYCCNHPRSNYHREIDICSRRSTNYTVIESQYSEYLEEQYQQIIYHPMHQYCNNDGIIYNKDQWYIYYDRDNDTVTYEPFSWYRFVIDVLSKIDPYGLLDSKYHLNSRLNVTSTSSYSKKEYCAHKFVRYLWNHISKQDTKYLLHNLLHMIEEYLMLKIDYNNQQFKYLVDEYKDCVIGTDDGKNGKIVDVLFHVRASQECDDDKYEVNGQLIYINHLDILYRMAKDSNIEFDEDSFWYNGNDPTNTIKDIVHNELDTIHILIERCNNWRNLIILLRTLCCSQKKRFGAFATFSIENITCIEILYEDGYRDQLLVNKEDYVIKQRFYEYKDLPKRCMIRLSYMRMNKGDKVTVKQIINMRHNGKYEPVMVQQDQMNQIVLIKKILNRLDDDKLTVDDSSFVSLRQYIEDYSDDRWYMPIYNRYKFNILCNLIYMCYTHKYLIADDPYRLDLVNRETTYILNTYLRKVPWIATIFERAEHRKNIKIEYQFLVDPKFISYLYDDDVTMFNKLFDPTTLRYHCANDLTGIMFTNMNPTESTNEYNLDYVMSGIICADFKFMRHLNNKHKDRLLHEIHRSSEDSYVNVLSKIASCKIKNRRPYHYAIKSFTKCINTYDLGQTIDFRLPYLVYLKITDNSSGKLVNDVELHDLPLIYRLVATSDLLKYIDNKHHIDSLVNDVYYRIIGEDHIKKLKRTILITLKECNDHLSQIVQDHLNDCKICDSFQNTITQMIYYDVSSGGKLFDESCKPYATIEAELYKDKTYSKSIFTNNNPYKYLQ